MHMAMCMWIHRICDLYKFQNHVPKDLKWIVDIGISVCKTKSLLKANRQLLPSGDFSSQFYRYLPWSWHFIQCMNKGMDPFILWSWCSQCLTFHQMATRFILSIIPPSVVHLYVSKANCHQASTLCPSSNCLFMSFPLACWNSLQCFLHYQQSLQFRDLFFKFY